MSRTWEELEGVSLAGEYRLKRYLGSEPDAAFFETTYGPNQWKAALKLLPDDGAGGERQLARWRAVAALSHPNLMPLLDCGRAGVGGDSFLYAIFEYPDDSLVSAVANGPLSEDETRDVLIAVLSALDYIHQRGMVHTAIDPDHVVAVGDRIKLASDTVRDARDSDSTPADDTRALGALLYQLRTGRRLAPGEIPDVSDIPEPLAGIIRHAAEPDPSRGWGLAQIAAALGRPDLIRPVDRTVKRPAEQPPAAPEPFHAEAAPPPAPEPLKPEPRPAVAAVPPPPPIELPPPARRPMQSEPAFTAARPRRTPATPLLLAATGAVVVAIALAVTHKGTPDVPTTEIAPAVTHAPAASAPPPASAVPPSPKAPAPGPPRPSPLAETQPPPAQSRGSAHRAANPRDSWRVIAYTYNHREHAEHKIETINKKSPGLHATLFAPHGGNQPPYFVALGGPMSREDAVALQRRARAKGMPRDTFVRNF